MPATTEAGTQSCSEMPTASRAAASSVAWTRRHGTSAARASFRPTEAAAALSGEPSTPTTIDWVIIGSSLVDGELALTLFRQCGRGDAHRRHQERGRQMIDQTFGDAPEQHALRPPFAVRPDDQHVRLPVVGLAQEGLYDHAVPHDLLDARGLHARPDVPLQSFLREGVVFG